MNVSCRQTGIQALLHPCATNAETPEYFPRAFLVNKKWAEMEGMDWGMIFCPSDTLMQIRRRRDGFFLPCQGLILHPTIQLEDGSCSAAWKLEFYWSRRIESVNINLHKNRIKTLSLLKIEQCKGKPLPISDWLWRWKTTLNPSPNPFWQQFPPSWGSGTSRTCNKLSVVAFWTNELIFTSPGGIQKFSRQLFVVDLRLIWNQSFHIKNSIC